MSLSPLKDFSDCSEKDPGLSIINANSCFGENDPHFWLLIGRLHLALGGLGPQKLSRPHAATGYVSVPNEAE